MRTKGKIYKFYSNKIVSNKNTYKCKFCKTIYTNRNATRMRQHTLKCKKCPMHVKRYFGYEVPKPQDTDIDDPSKPEDQVIDESIAKAVYVTGIPLHTFEHPLWRSAFDKLRRSYVPPTRKQLSTTLLEKEYNNIAEQTKRKITESSVLHLSVDGWSNLRNEGVLNIMVYTPQPLFHSFIQTGRNKHTSEYIMSEITTVIDSIGAEKFTAITTDNASNMKRCGQLLENQYDNLIWIGCIAHTLHLNVSDILKQQKVRLLLNKVTSVVTTVRQSQILSANFKQIASEQQTQISLALPCKTRWGSTSRCLANFISSKHILQTLSINDEINDKFSFTQKEDILSRPFWLQVTILRDFIKIFSDWITVLEGDTSKIYKVCDCFKEIMQSLNNETIHDILAVRDIEYLKKQFKKREDRSLMPVHYAACLLNPINKGRNFTGSEHMIACESISTFARQNGNTTEVFQQLSDYQSKVGFWGNQFLEDIEDRIEPTAWWKCFFEKTELGRLAITILTIPATSAAVERSFSAFANIHTTQRHRLTANRAGKISYIAYNWKILNRLTTNRTQCDSTLEHLEDSYCRSQVQIEDNSEDDIIMEFGHSDDQTEVRSETHSDVEMNYEEMDYNSDQMSVQSMNVNGNTSEEEPTDNSNTGVQSENESEEEPEDNAVSRLQSENESEEEPEDNAVSRLQSENESEEEPEDNAVSRLQSENESEEEPEDNAVSRLQSENESEEEPEDNAVSRLQSENESEEEPEDNAVSRLQSENESEEEPEDNASSGVQSENESEEDTEDNANHSS